MQEGISVGCQPLACRQKKFKNMLFGGSVMGEELIMLGVELGSCTESGPGQGFEGRNGQVPMEGIPPLTDRMTNRQALLKKLNFIKIMSRKHKVHEN